jgi:signal transduction histidine kinase
MNAMKAAALTDTLLRVLLVEDSPTDARLFQIMLKEAAGVAWEVRHADRLSMGLKDLAERDIDVVLLDLSLPDSQGIETLVRIHAAAKGVPIVVLTGIEDEALGVALVQAGGQDYLVKGQVTGPLLTRSLRYAAQRKRTEDQLQCSLNLLRLLSRRLEVIREEERGRIARELHDQLGVGLTCLKMDLARLPALMGNAVGSRAHSKVDAKIRSMMEDIDATIAAVQRIVMELRPSILDDLGLVAAIEWQAQEFERRSGIVCLCTFSADDMNVDSERATVVFRILQEALTNVARHAQATHVTIRLEEKAGSIRLEVHDDGQGIHEEQITDSRSLGLVHMRERARLFGGRVDITGRQGKGSTIILCLPSG